MTRNTTMKAAFLAALMVLSVIAVPFAFAGGVAADHSGDVELTENKLVFQGQTVYVDVDNESNVSNAQLNIVEDGDARPVSELSASTDNSDQIEVDTDNLDSASYRVTYSDGSTDKAVNFSVTEQTLTLEIDEETSEVSVPNDGDNAEVDFTGSSNRNKFALNVSADSLDENDLEEIFDDTGLNVTKDADEERITIHNFTRDQTDTLNFTDIDAGEYEFDFEITDTGVTQTINVAVSDSGEGTLDVEAVDVTQGDVAAFEVSLDNTDSGALVIGNADDDGYQANVSIENADEDTVTVYFNTYTAGNESGNIAADDIVTADSDEADVALENQDDDAQTLGSILDTGSYEVAVGAVDSFNADDFGSVIDDPDTISTLSINERSELSANQWRAGEDTIEDLEEVIDDEDDAAAVETISSAVKNDLITETDSFAVQSSDASGSSDYQIHQISADGIEGLLANQSGDSLDDVGTTGAFVAGLQQNNSVGDGDRSILFELEEQDPGANQDGNTINLNDVAQDGDLGDYVTEVVYDDDANDYYVVIDTQALADDDLIEEDQTYDVTFAVQDNKLLDEDNQDDLEDAYEEANWEFDLVEADGEFLGLNDDDELEVEAGEDQDITVDTNVAPGTQLDLRARNADGTSPSFIKTESDLVVAADGTVTGTFDFSDQSVDDEFTSSVRLASFSLEGDGVVVEEVVKEPDDETAPEDDGNTTEDGNMSDDDVSDDDTDVSDDTDTEDDTGSEDGDTDEETPGFGALVALVAVLGAALLATRRQN